MLRVTRSSDLASQARRLQATSPALYEYLEKRDREVERALARIPSQTDVELGSVFNVRSYLDQTLEGLAPGVGELSDGVRDEIPRRQSKP